MKVAILQSNYIPWKGYFDIINMADLFIFHDDLQYTSSDWRNRNKIKTDSGLGWLTVPCGKSEKRLICEVELFDKKWHKQHWAKIYQNYRKTKYFNIYSKFFENIYLNMSWNNLSEMNQYIITNISRQILNIETEFDDSRKYMLKNKKEKRVIELLKKVSATEYISGPAAKNYLIEDTFYKENIKLTWVGYDNYLEYNQRFPPFEHQVSILDLIFNEGPNATKFMKSFKGKI